MELAKIRHAVELTAQCHSVDYCGNAPADSRWVATLWCNELGERVIGEGPDAWTAVQAAHAESARYRNRRVHG